ncbi:L-rhamnose mutarotase [Zunongwangia endophytica]|uniref:L-rhamnose mutarotase n=1 Tax=Zunongwangia endophytica TaxID=1808945 RepID=A0ABV8H6F7_9FLAO|nr:L-rhamnose mutarotase [Zunongwangia endophytica]MDN3594814.1 L-rhamnose mutarotase [Zunongwangia endophytica]
MKRYCFTCDLENDPELIAKYKEYHKKGNVWNEILESIRTSGISGMQIYLIETRLFMIMDTSDEFNLENKEVKDANNEIVQSWERLMGKFQKIPEFSKYGKKWVLMDKIFDLTENK